MFRATKIVCYLKAMLARGIDASSVLAETGINVDLVGRDDYLISLEQYYGVLANVIRLADDPGISFAIGDYPGFNDYGIVGYAMISACNLRESLAIWNKYANSLIGSPMWTHIVDSSPGYQAIIASPAKDPELHRFETEEMLAQAIKLIEALTGIRPKFGKVALDYPEPPNRALYDELLACRLEFNAPHTVTRILEPDLTAPIRTVNEETYRLCTEHCRAVLRSIADTDEMEVRLRNLFLENPGRLPSLHEAGARLGLSTRSLARHLESTGKNYQALKDAFRFDLARAYLRAGHTTPKQVAWLLGFNSPGTFARAFKAWSGQTVGEFLRS